MPSEARACACAVVGRALADGAYVDRALRSHARALTPRERAQAKRLAFGAIQRRGTLEHLIVGLAQRPVERLDWHVRAALLLGLYELLYADGAPDRAVVSDAVELAKQAGRGGHGLVNAVLRRAAREGRSLLEDLREDTPAAAAVKHSHPPWLAALWWEQLGAERARALMAAGNEPGEQALRANTLIADAATLARELAPVASHLDGLIPEAVVLEGPFDAHGSSLWRRGAFLAQSRAAMLASRLLGPEPGERTLDLCAGPGGKSTHLAALTGGKGEVVAVERDRRRAGALARTAQRLHAANVRVEVADAAAPRGGDDLFERVLVDPPCSGLGTLQAHPDLRWRMTPARIEELVGEQARILAAGADAVRPGGVLVYSTCTISASENERQIATFLDAHPEFGLDDLRAECSRYGNPRSPETVLTLPDRDGTAGFFVARLRREG
ncbi:MAG TPA: 16S rRNA (cytosine(967)-C(5))-methyltransferase RsmB [Solirubrobacteraceae bacterium]|nr:16S rRNA (cytosine(967)-C(5))-methyltransferase RsmB [Solirubrobacteraceae bacterium]